MRAPFFALAVAVVGCGSSSEPRATTDASPPPDVDVVETAPEKPVRTLKKVGLFGGVSTENLLIDPTLEDGSAGIGRWYSNSSAGVDGRGPEIEQRVMSSSPHGLALPVGAVSDVPESGAPRAFTLLAQFPGGKGPFVVKLWVSTEKPLEGDATVASFVRVSISGATGGTAVDVPVDAGGEKTIDGRKWTLFRGEVPGPYTLGGFMNVRFRASRNRWWLQAPEIVPKSLLATLEARSLKPSSLPRPLDGDELFAIARTKRIPLDLGVGLHGGMPHEPSHVPR